MAWLFLLIAFASAILASLLDHRHPFRAACIRTGTPILIWLLIFSATFSSLGLLLSYQPTVSSIPTPVLFSIIAGVASALLAFAFFTGRFVLRQARLPRIERSLFYNMARLSLIVLAVVTTIFPLICVSDRKTRSAIAESLNQFPRNVLYHLRVRGSPAIRNENIADAWMQWGFHGGLYWTVGFWLGALFLIYAARARSSRGSRRPGSSAETGRAFGPSD